MIITILPRYWRNGSSVLHASIDAVQIINGSYKVIPDAVQIINGSYKVIPSYGMFIAVTNFK